MNVKITAEQLREECSAHGIDAVARTLIANKYGLKESTVKKYIASHGIKTAIEDRGTLQANIEKNLNSHDAIEPEVPETLRPMSWESLDSGFTYNISNGMLNISNKVNGALAIYPADLDFLMLDLTNLKKHLRPFMHTTPEAKDVECYILVDKSEEEPPKPIVLPVEPEPETGKQKFTPGKKVAVFYRCPECDKTGFAYTDKPDVKCRGCGHNLRLYGIQTARIICPNCGESYTTRVADGVNCVACRSCKGPVDIEWNERKKMFETVAATR